MGILFIFLLLTMIDVGNSNVNVFFSHIDEFVEVLCIFYLFLNVRSKGLKDNQAIEFTWIILLSIGVIGSIFWMQQNLVAIVQDMLFTCSKFLIAYLAGFIYFNKRNKNISAVYSIAKILVVVLTLLSIHDLVLPAWFPVSDYRYFMYSQKLFFTHSTYLTHVAATLLFVFVFGSLKNKANMKLYMVMASYLIILAMRTKGIAFLFVFWIVYVYLFIFKAKRREFIYLGGTAVATLLGFDAFESYFLNTERYSPRRLLLLDSLSILKSEFPIGTGFASFGSPVAAQYYSPIYTKLGYGNNWGMGQYNNMFLSDNFWPCIFAQFGFLGAIIFCIVIFLFLKKVIRILKNDKQSGFILLMIMIYMLISSLAETSFFNPTSMLLFFIFAYIEINAMRKT